MKTLALLFVIVLLINLMPAFAPPTWMAMSWVGFNIHEGNMLLVAAVAASAATAGRLTLAALSRSLVRGRWLRDADRQNIDVVSTWLGKHREKTAGAFLVYGVIVLFVLNLAVLFDFPFKNNWIRIHHFAGARPFDAKSGACFRPRTDRRARD
ncbi:hypothetical protein [Paraburkholderia guartelaensis]|uniref:hypothetical protein n=1 Tax=Paraburkholderia guartelaensis TaxID=2546446 RepID=UPI0038BD86C1